MSKKEYVLLTSKSCSACRDLERKAPNMPNDIRKVTVESAEGARLIAKLKGKIGVPDLLEKEGGRIRSCKLFISGKRIYGRCTGGRTKELNPA